MVKNPQCGHGRTDCRVAVIARAIFSGCSPRDCTIHKAMRSAERGPIPGICRNCAIKSRIDDGYSVFLKTGDRLLVQRRIGQLQGERLEPAEIQLQRSDLLHLRDHAHSEIASRLRPTVFLDRARRHSRTRRAA